jgi:hypothetical protein
MAARPAALAAENSELPCLNAVKPPTGMADAISEIE